MVRPHLVKDRPGKSWKKRTDGKLWRRVLSQIVVVGGAEPGHRFQHDPAISRQLSIRKLSEFKHDAELQKHLHHVFVGIGVRYTGSSWRSDKKAVAGTKNFRTLIKAGGPRKFFERVSNYGTEDERIAALQRSLKFYGSKGSRDTPKFWTPLDSPPWVLNL
jgi:hypothetical protein